jgi:hypothetical protein
MGSLIVNGRFKTASLQNRGKSEKSFNFNNFQNLTLPHVELSHQNRTLAGGIRMRIRANFAADATGQADRGRD